MTMSWLRPTQIMTVTMAAPGRTRWIIPLPPRASWLTLRAGTAEGAQTGHDMIADFEQVIGGSGDDRISCRIYGRLP